jgi:peptide/nickel transport system substrate-binding protein
MATTHPRPLRRAFLRTLHATAAALCLAVGLFAATAAPAQTLRWASAGDAQTMDPYSQNEGLTNSINQMAYERLVRRDAQLNIVPGLAASWEQTGPLSWRFKLRPGVKFHDGAPLTADDVVFSVLRARAPTSQISNYANAIGEPKKIDDLTVEFQLAAPNPIFLQHLDAIFIMNKAWCEKHNATRPQDFKNKEESYSAFNANGTGPFILVSRQPGIRTVHKRNPAWWGAFEGNVQESVFTPITSDPTRLAALISGEIDFVLDPAPRDVARLRRTEGVKVIDGPENRVVFIGMDQQRDKLLYGKVPGDRNPFKDARVRRALYQAIDIETMKTRLMAGLSVPTGGNTPSPLGAYNDARIEARFPYDLAAARKLMADAGYADGFEVTLDCPNNRYINDEEICVSLAAMWAQLKVQVKVNAMPRVTYFAKLDKIDTSMYMLGWGGNVTDAETTLTPVMRNAGDKGVGYYNYGRSTNDKFDALAAKSSVETDPKKREELIKAALTEWKEQVHTIPLHRQIIPWAARQNVNAVHRADNYLTVEWVRVGR